MIINYNINNIKSRKKSCCLIKSSYLLKIEKILLSHINITKEAVKITIKNSIFRKMVEITRRNGTNY